MKLKYKINLVFIFVLIGSILYTVVSYSPNLMSLYDDKSEFYFLLIELSAIIGMTIENLKNRKNR